jgi:hypothetical protein
MKNKICSIIAFLLSVAIALASQVCFAQDWPQWRGPNRDGVVVSFPAPKVWPDKLKTLWKMPVGIGHSSPVTLAGEFTYTRGRTKTKSLPVWISTQESCCGTTPIQLLT